MSRLVGLYPRAWRDRYGAELADLLEQRPPSLLDRVDLVRGAVDARIHPQLVVPASPEPIDDGVISARRAGWFTLAGAASWLGGLVVALNGPLVHDSWGTYREGAGGWPLFILAVALLAVGVAATALRLPSGDLLGRAGAWLAGGGLLWVLAPWVLVTGLIGALGFVCLGAAAVRAGHWPAWGVAAALAALAALPLALSGLLPVPGGAVESDGQYIVVGGLVVLWLVVAGPLVGRPAVARPTGS